MPQKVAKKSGEKRARMPTIFSSEYAKLNPAQKRAVDTIEGPVMVVAGPGTGKTQVVAMRVANVLKKTHMRPANILCLTFSVSGATAMRERLRLLIGADAYRVTVSTIHAFAQSVIEQNAILFDEWSAKEQISDLETVRELNTIIDQFIARSALLNPKDPYGKTLDLLSHISQVKREGKSSEDLVCVAGAFEEQMQAKSKPGTNVHGRNLLSAKKFRDFVEIFKRYQEMLSRTGRYDYEDMILHVIRALQEEDWLLASLQERYQYVLVDEFQDTNGAQYRLIELLTTYKDLPHEPNMFIVGDDDQAIYRFQGANLQNMVAFHKRFPKAPVIALTMSYRSSQAILDAAGTLIAQNQERLVGTIPGLQKTLLSAARHEGSLPRLLRAPSNTAEPWLIADLAEERIAAGTPPEEIAILTQTNSELFPIAEVLRARKIPVLLRGKDDLLSHSLVLQALTIFRAIDDPRNDSKLSAALGCACFGLHPADLGRVHGLARERKMRLRDLLTALPPSEELALHALDDLLTARDTLLDLHQKISSRTALETVEHVLRDCTLIPVLPEGADSAVDPRDPAALDALFSYVRQRCLDWHTCTFRDLLRDLDYYSDPTYTTVQLSYELPHLSTSGVQLLTAHQSKGLEFDVVILTNFRDGHWDKRTRPSGVSIPEDLLFGWKKEQRRAEQHEDERRVCFVAMTRARKELLMTCPRELTVGEKSRTVGPSGFFAEMGVLPEEEAHLREPEKASLLLHPKPQPLEGALRGYLEERLKTFALSPTSLNRFLHDPQEFLLVDLLQQPEHFDERAMRSLGYGSAVHWALRQWAVARKEGRDFLETHFVEAFGWYLRERTVLTDRQRESLLSLGSESLPRYFAQRLHPSRPFLHAIEREYRTHWGDIPLKGKIDRIDRASETSAAATVIDYKAGKGKSESDIRGSIETGGIARGEDGAQFRQLVFYALLLDGADPLLEPEAFVLEYIGERGEDPLTRRFVIAETEKKDLRALISEVWKKITEFDFRPL